MIGILIPIKEPARVKTRLSQWLTLAERQQLVWAMFEDVCAAVAASAKAHHIFIVTNSDKASAYAQSLGFDVLLEARQESESVSVDWASRILRERGFETGLRLPADIPLVAPADIDRLLMVERAKPGALLVPSIEGTGTNAILRTPPDLFPSRFGPGSLALHQTEAARVGAQCLIINNPRIALDIDEPKDLQAFLTVGSETKTLKALQEMNLIAKIST